MIRRLRTSVATLTNAAVALAVLAIFSSILTLNVFQNEWLLDTPPDGGELSTSLSRRAASTESVTSKALPSSFQSRSGLELSARTGSRMASPEYFEKGASNTSTKSDIDGDLQDAVNLTSPGNSAMATLIIPETTSSKREPSNVTLSNASMPCTNSTFINTTNHNSSRPPLDSIIGGRWDIIGDPQFLLDFAIIGHGKAGTSTLMRWLGEHKEVRCIQEEVWDMLWGRPASLIRRLYQTIPEGPYHRGYKSPSDIEGQHVFEYFRNYFPKTKLIVGIRHPVRWFESLYNFRVQNLDSLPEPFKLIGACRGHSKNTCTDKGIFHLNLARMGKVNSTTPLMKQDGMQRKRYKRYLRKMPPPIPNPVFLYDTKQLSDTNESRAFQFRKDLQTFLGLMEEFPPAPRIVPYKRTRNQTAQAIKDKRKIDICEDTYVPLRNVLMEIARDASVWIRKYFIHSQDVTVSTVGFFEELMASWMEDPCESSQVTH